MEYMNNLFLHSAVAALIPMFIGFIYYNPKVMGNAWMKASGMTEEKVNSGNMFLIMGLSLLFSFFMAITLHFLVVHQMAAISLFAAEPSVSEAGSEFNNYVNNLVALYGDRHRTFGHGAFHGGITSIMFALPIIAIISLFERRSFKYVMIHLGYWAITLILMCGLISAWV